MTVGWMRHDDMIPPSFLYSIGGHGMEFWSGTARHGVCDCCMAMESSYCQEGWRWSYCVRTYVCAKCKYDWEGDEQASLRAA